MATSVQRMQQMLCLSTYTRARINVYMENRVSCVARAPEAAIEAGRLAFEYRLSGRPQTWLTMIAAPGDDLPEVERTLKLKFGAERVLDVRPYHPKRT